MLELKFMSQNDTLTVFLNNRIDSNNVGEVEEAIVNIIDNNPHAALVLDAEGLEYISSAGLRVILRLKKKEPSMEIINANQDVYEIFDMTGFTEMMDIQKAYRQLNVDGCQIIGEGAKGTVYRYNPEIVVKVYKNPDSISEIKNERELAKRAFVLGVPTAISYDIVKVGDKYGSVFELLDAKSLTEMLKENPQNLDEYAKITADLLRQINATPVKESDMKDAKIPVYNRLSSLAGYIDAQCIEKIKKLVDEVPNDLLMIHGDYHTNNIMYQNNEVILIDMDTLSRGNAIFELPNVYIAYVGFGKLDPGMTEKFFKLDYNTTVLFYNAFIKYYLGTTDEAKIRETMDKVELLSNIRYFNHLSKRHQLTDENVHYLKEQIETLAKKVDKLAL